MDGTVRCVVEDVTDEVLQTKALQVERDRDGLTGVGNRLAFEKRWNVSGTTLAAGTGRALSCVI